MQTTGGEAATTAITAAVRQWSTRVRVDWGRQGAWDHPLADLSPLVIDLSTDQALKGSAPEEVLLVEGSGVRELKVSVAGNLGDQPVTTVLGGHPPSPLTTPTMIGAEITAEIGIDTLAGMVWWPQFRGLIRTMSVDRSTGIVEITALDFSELLRRPVKFPQWALSEAHWRRTHSQLINSQWVIDHCLRGSDISPTPWRPATRTEWGGDNTLQLWVTCCGSTLPLIGWPDNNSAQQFPLGQMWQPGVAHPHSPEPTTKPLARTGLTEDFRTKFWAADLETNRPLGPHWIGFTLLDRPTGPVADVIACRTFDDCELAVLVGQDGVMAELRYGKNRIRSTLEPWPEAQNTFPLDLRVHWDVRSPPTPTNVEIHIGKQRRERQSLRSPTLSGLAGDSLAGLVTVCHRAGLADVFWAVGQGTAPLPTQPARLPAVLDRGLNWLSHIPTRDTADAWHLIGEVASAEFGAALFDENGVFRFWNAQRLEKMRENSVRTLTLDDISSLKVTHSLDSIRNVWAVDRKKKRAIYGCAYSSGDPDEFRVEPHQTRRVPVWSDQAVCPNPFALPRFHTTENTTPKWDDSVIGGFVAQFFLNGQWVEQPQNKNPGGARVFFSKIGSLIVEASNSTPFPMRFATNSGQAAFRIPGTVVLDCGSSTRHDTHEESIRKFGRRSLELSGPWVQDTFPESGVFSSLMARMAEPITTTDQIKIPGDPRLQLGDTVDIMDPHGVGVWKAQICGIRREFSTTSGLTDTLTVEKVH